MHMHGRVCYSVSDVRSDFDAGFFRTGAGDGTGAAVSGLPVARSKRVVRLFGVNLDCPAGEVSQPAWADGL